MDNNAKRVPPTSSPSDGAHGPAGVRSSNQLAAASADALSATAGAAKCSTSQSCQDPTLQPETLHQEARKAADYLHQILSKNKEYAALTETRIIAKDHSYCRPRKNINEKAKSDQEVDIWDTLHNFYETLQKMVPNPRVSSKIKTRGEKPRNELLNEFEKAADKYMKNIGYCCGCIYFYCWPTLTCDGTEKCIIELNDVYYSYNDWIVCKNCFEKDGDEIALSTSQQKETPIPKKDFLKLVNDKDIREPFVTCINCERRFHQICMLHVDEIYNSKFLCNKCIKEKKIVRKANMFRAKGLPCCALAKHMESRVQITPEFSDVTIRVLHFSNSSINVDENIRKCFRDMPASFPVNKRTVFAFREEDGRDLCFFGMFLEEYPADGLQRNSLRVNLAYIDSVKLLKLNSDLRTKMYQTIVISYLDYVRLLGYAWCHIWSCPPNDSSHDYIFNCHPRDQQIPTRKSLNNWYKTLLQRAIDSGVVSEYQMANTYFKDKSKSSSEIAESIPFYSADPWSYGLKKAAKHVEEAIASAKTKTTLVNSRGTKTSERAASVANVPTASEASDIFFKTAFEYFTKLSHNIFVIKLNTSAAIQSNTAGFEEYLHCELMESRETFQPECRRNRWEFCSVRRALFSSMAFLHRVYIDSGIVICSKCQCAFRKYYKCSVCTGFILCESCYKKHSHDHHMNEACSNLEGSVESDGSDIRCIDRLAVAPGNVITSPKQNVDEFDIAEHACHCVDTMCTVLNCMRFKDFFQHEKTCKNNPRTSCSTCRELMKNMSRHARYCKNSDCSVPQCRATKMNREKQKERQERMRMETLHAKTKTMLQSDDYSSGSIERNSFIGTNDDANEGSDIEDDLIQPIESPVSPGGPDDNGSNDNTWMAKSAAIIILNTLLLRSRKEAERKKRFRKENCVLMEQLLDISDKIIGASLPDHDHVHQLLKETEKDFINSVSSDVWHVVNDINKIFDLILQHSKGKTTDCTKRVELVRSMHRNLDAAMQGLGYCCGQTYCYSPQALPCCLRNQCYVKVGDVYFSHKNRIICESCFANASASDIDRELDQYQPPVQSTKEKFLKFKNEKTIEPFIMCTECERQFHQTCVIYTRFAYHKEFVCSDCLTSKNKLRKQDTFRAKELPQCHLATQLECRVKNNVTSHGVDKVIIRVVQSPKACTKVDEIINPQFSDMPDKIEIKTIFAFQEVDGSDVCFFGMCVQKYDSICQSPNAAHVYISHAESIPNAGIKKELCNTVCEEIILGYLECAIASGYQWCHILPNSTAEKDQCLFYCNQHNDGSLDISKVLKTAVTNKLIVNFKQGEVYFKGKNYKCPSAIPYFGSDLLPDVESIIKIIKQKTGAETADNRDSIAQQVLSEICERHKIIVVELQSASATSGGNINDSAIQSLCHLMGRPYDFLSECRKNHWEFSSPRRIRFSSMAFLHKLVYAPVVKYRETTCDSCGNNVNRHYCCTVCTSFSLCSQCYKIGSHKHKMDVKWSGANDVGPDNSACDGESSDLSVALPRFVNVRDESDTLEHFRCYCNDATCTIRDCSKTKDIFMHIENLNMKTTTEDAELCKWFLDQCSSHAKNCTLSHCAFPLCLTTRKNRKKPLYGDTSDGRGRSDTDGSANVSAGVNVGVSSPRRISAAIGCHPVNSSPQTPRLSENVAAPVALESIASEMVKFSETCGAGVYQRSVMTSCLANPIVMAESIKQKTLQQQKQSPVQNFPATLLLQQQQRLLQHVARQSMSDWPYGDVLPIVELLTMSAASIQNSSQSASESPMQQQRQPLLPQERLLLNFPPQQLLRNYNAGSPGTVRVLIHSNHDVQAAADQQVINQTMSAASI